MFITEQVKDELQGYNLFNTLKHDKAIKLQEENVNEQKLNKEELGKCVELLFNDSSLYLSSAFRMRVLRLIEEIEEEKR
ncbi:MAG: hypothetical protein SCARUB_00014 [Candidatus Scalindua rubra]|uniref:Uncharacterized protein n=1 Tax=Candidatus Scalindua rubra TaxID=1872076 RepID=A0A1E3XIM3_9BACT|nr:MAG: hypothetical protein SCARUB_00014 [Candidatus Scalindua rubra]